MKFLKAKSLSKFQIAIGFFFSSLNQQKYGLKFVSFITERRKKAPKNLPKRLRKAGKYNDKPYFSNLAFQSLDIPEDIKSTLAKTANFSLAIKTKSAYKTAYNMLMECQNETGKLQNFPLNEEQVLTFVGWCLKKGNKATTIRSYLSGLKKAHVANNFTAPKTDTPLIKSVLDGHMNKVNQSSRASKAKRLPCTLNTLRLIKGNLKKSKLQKSEKIAIHAACTTLFFGAIRAGEALTKSEKVFDPTLCITKGDLKFVEPSSSENKRSVEITMKNSKTNRSRFAETLVIYETGDELCPIKALDKLMICTKNLPKSAPLFATSEGKPITQKRLNSVLKELVSPHLKNGGQVTGHSFRAGLISIFAKAGYSDDKLQQIGRWSSRAFEFYIKNGKTNRHQMAIHCSNVAKL